MPLTLSISTGASTPVGTYAITISGTTTGGFNRTQSLSLTVQAGTGAPSNPDFALAVSNPSITIGPNEPAVFNGTLTTSGGYASAVTLSCAGSVPLSCTPSPAKVAPTAAGAPFTVTTSSDVQNTYNFNIVATGTDPAHVTHSTAVELVVGFDFALNNNSAAQTIAAGQTASFNLDAVPLGNGSVFPGNLALSCATAGLPPLSTCSFTPTQVSSGSGDTNVLLNIVTSTATPVSGRVVGVPGRLWYEVGFSLAGIVLAFGGWKKPGRRRRKQVLLIILGVLIGGFGACGGGSSGDGSGAGHPGTTPGNYTITVNGTVGSITRSAQVGLTVQ